MVESQQVYGSNDSESIRSGERRKNGLGCCSKMGNGISSNGNSVVLRHKAVNDCFTGIYNKLVLCIIKNYIVLHIKNGTLLNKFTIKIFTRSTSNFLY